MGRKTAFVIPTAVREDLLRECLQSLQRQTSTDFEIILVSDAAGPWVEKVAPEFGCKLIVQPTRCGFAAAINRGVLAAESEYVAILNDDVQLNPDWLLVTSSLLDDRADVAFCCGKIYSPDRVVLDNVGDAISLAGSAWRLGHGRSDSKEFGEAGQSITCPGTASLLRKSAFEQLGGFDEVFVSYLEDIDFSLRAIRAGLKGMYLPEAQCVHWGGATSGGATSSFVFRMLSRNQLVLLAKNYPWQMLLQWLPRIFWAQTLWAAMAIRKGRFLAYMSGIGSFIACLPRVLGMRRTWTQEEMLPWINDVRRSEVQLFSDVFAPDRIEKDTFWKMYFFLFAPIEAGNRHAN